jgi:hypothetical protein
MGRRVSPQLDNVIRARVTKTAPLSFLKMWLSLSSLDLRFLTKTIPLLLLVTAVFSAALAWAAYQPVDVRTVPDSISVRMHQTTRFAFEQSGDRLLNPRPVSRPRNEPTIMLQLTNSLGGGVSGVTTALITSKYPNILRCRGAAHFKGRPGFVATGEYTVNRRDPTAARFHEPIEEFVIWDLRLSDERK